MEGFTDKSELASSLRGLSHKSIEDALVNLYGQGVLTYPQSPEALSYAADDVGNDFRALSDAATQLNQMLHDNPEEGWTNEQVDLLSAGFDIAVMLLHQVAMSRRR